MSPHQSMANVKLKSFKLSLTFLGIFMPCNKHINLFAICQCLSFVKGLNILPLLMLMLMMMIMMIIIMMLIMLILTMMRVIVDNNHDDTLLLTIMTQHFSFCDWHFQWLSGRHELFVFQKVFVVIFSRCYIIK